MQHFAGLPAQIDTKPMENKTQQPSSIHQNHVFDQYNCSEIDTCSIQKPSENLKRKRNYKSIFTKFSKF